MNDECLRRTSRVLTPALTRRHALMLGAVFSRQPGVTRILEMLHFPVKTVRLPELGDLPLPCIAVSVTTIRPPDDIIIESTELSGMNVFEEVVNVEQIVGMSDPLRPEVRAAVGRCEQAGVRVVMATGDHRSTAIAIARQLGL